MVDREKKFIEKKKAEKQKVDDERLYKVLKKRLDYFEKTNSINKRDFEITKMLLDFEIEHNQVKDGKPAYLFEQRYHDLLKYKKQIEFEKIEIDFKDKIAHSDKAIEDIKKELDRLREKLNIKE